jgi:sugar lactone lactonase YvrE
MMDGFLRGWSDWAEGSDEGLWEGDSTHLVSIRTIWTLGGDSPDPAFYTVESMAFSGETLFVTDSQAERLVAMDMAGNVLWRSGSPGEGPGCFTGIGQVACSGGAIAVTNQSLGRIDVFSRAGEWTGSIPFMQPYDICFVDDSTLAVVSLVEPGHLVTLMGLDGIEDASFGTWEHPTAALPGANRNLHCALVAPGLLAVTSYYANHIQLMDLEARTMRTAFSRDLPMDIPESEIGESGGMMTFSLQTFLIDVTAGPAGTIDVLLRPVARDSTIGGPGAELSGASIVDRFDMEGRYLDSYAIPGSAGTIMFDGTTLFADDWQEGTLTMMTFDEGPPAGQDRF